MWVAGYILSIVLVNWLFVAIPMIPTPMGDWTVANVLVGFVFILRDMAQRQLGHYVILATLFAGVLTWFSVDPFVATASVTAFLLSETTDWIVYSVTKRPLRDRILLSSAMSSPVDTLAFLGIMGFLTPASFTLETTSKLLGAIAVWLILRHRARKISDPGA
ncbi:MAG: VUT family protein [Parvibaculaceae bacterium]